MTWRQTALDAPGTKNTPAALALDIELGGAPSSSRRRPRRRLLRQAARCLCRAHLGAGLCLALLLVGPRPALARDPAQRLYQRIKKAEFPSKGLGIKLGRLKSPRAKELLLQLFRKGDLFQREVAAFGLAALEDPAAARVLLERAQKRGDEEVIQQAFARFYPAHHEALVAAFGDGSRRTREVTLGIMARARDRRAEAFLKGVARDRSSDLRAAAVRHLTTHYAKKNGGFFRELARDKTLAPGLRGLLAVRDPRVSAGVRAVLKAGFLPQTIARGRKLGRLRSPDARAALLQLLEHKSHWIRLAAVAGLLEQRTAEVVEPLVMARFSDHMIADAIDDGFARVSRAYQRRLIQLYDAQPAGAAGAARRRWILTAVGAGPAASARAFLRRVVAGEDPTLRPTALAALVRAATASQRAYFLGLAGDSALAPQVLAYLARFGKKEDLPRLRAPLRLRVWAAATAVPAMNGVRRLGDRVLQRRTYEAAMIQGDEAVRAAAMGLFSSHRSPTILAGLVAVVRTSRSPTIRAVAGRQLIKYRDPAAVPALIRLLGEPYRKNPDEALKPVLFLLMPVAVMAADMTGHQLTSARRNRAQHRRRARAYAAALRRVTGVNHGTSVKKWRSWARASGLALFPSSGR